MLKRLLLVLLIAMKVSGAFAEKAPTPLILSFEQRILLSYALLAHAEGEERKKDLAERVLALKNRYLTSGIREFEVRNFNEFLKMYQGDWPNTNSLDLDVRLIESQEARGILKFKSKNPNLQKKIDQFLASTNLELLKMANVGGLKAINTENIDSFSGTAFEIGDRIMTEQIAQLDKVGEAISNSQHNLGADQSLKILLETMFREYFKRLSPASKKQMLSALLGGDLRADNLSKFSLMLQNSGPPLQKMLQVVASGKKDLSPEIVALFKSLENSVREVPWVQVEALLQAEKANYNFIYFEKKPIGVGTMAQVHRAKIIWQGEKKDVVVRFLKPGIAERIDEDRRILSEIATILDANPDLRQLGIPKLGPLVADIIKTVIEELDQEATIKRQDSGKRYYKRELIFQSPEYRNTLKIHVPKIYHSEKSSRFMVSEMVHGQKLDDAAKDFMESIPSLKRVISEQVARLWIQEVMFGSGFFHSDLHQGNFMVQVTDPEIRVAILDFGMGGVLSKRLRERVIILGAGIDLLDDKLIAESYFEMSNKDTNEVSSSDFKDRVSAKVERIKRGLEPRLSVDTWTAWVLDQGLRLPYEFISLNRGVLIVSRMLAAAGSKESFSSLTKQIALQNPVQTLQVLRDVGKLSMPDLTRLAWIQFAGKTPITKSQGVVRCEGVF